MPTTDEYPSYSRIAELLRHPNCWHALLLALAICPYFVNLDVSSLWDSNEAFYAETPREMMESGDYIIPRFNYYFRWHKPPLTYWAIASFYRIGGISELSARLPIALAAAAWIFICYVFGRMWAGRNEGLLAALILAVNFRVFIMARRAITEIWLAFWVSLSLALFVLILTRKPRYSGALLALAYTALGLAILTKGPVAAVIVGGTVLLYILLHRNWADLAAVRPWLGLAILAAILVPWYWNVVQIIGWQPVKTFLLSDNFGRYLTEDFGPQRGPWYYPAVLIADFFPWSIIGVCGILALRKKLLPKTPEQKAVGAWLMLWICWVLVFFSISRNKQEYYILPLYLPASILIAYLLHAAIGAPLWASIQRGAYYAMAALSIVAGLFLALRADLLFPDLPHAPALAAGAGLVLVGGWLGRASWRERWNLSSLISIGLLWSMLWIMCWLILPQWEHYKPVKQFAEMIQKQRGANDYCGYYKYSAPSLAFYLKEPIFEIIWENQIIHLLSKAPRRIYCIIEEKEFIRIRSRLEQPYRIIASRPLLGFRMRDLARIGAPQEKPQLLLISNSP